MTFAEVLFGVSFDLFHVMRKHNNRTALKPYSYPENGDGNLKGTL